MYLTASPMAFIVPLSSSAHSLAENFGKQQTSVQKAKQVYLNTLAVFAVEFYLRCMKTKTDWKASLSWEPVAQLLMDIADLEVSGLGKLECRPVWLETESVEIPLEVWSNRIGYVVVQLDNSLRQATLLGFSETLPATGELRISSLRSLEDLLEHLDQLSQPEPVKIRANLSLWLQNVFGPDWRSLESLFGTEERNLVVSLRSGSQLNTASVKRAKLINLGLQLGRQAVTLLVIVTKEASRSEITVRVQLHPAGGEDYLPPNIKLALLSESGEALDDAESRSWGFDNFIQLYEFEGLPGECFSIQVASGERIVTENFVI